jgi:hypothetical protein
MRELTLRPTNAGVPCERESPYAPGTFVLVTPLVMNAEEVRAVKVHFDAHSVVLDAAGYGRVALQGATITFNSFNVEGDLVEVHYGDLRCASAFLFTLSQAGGLVICDEKSGPLLATSAIVAERVGRLEPKLREELGEVLEVVESADELFRALMDS